MLSAGSSVRQPDASGSTPPPDFALIRAAMPFAGVPSGPRVLPCFAKRSLTPCRLPYAGRPIRCPFPSLPEWYQSSPVGPRLDSFIVPVSQISRGIFRRGRDHLMVRPGLWLAPPSDLAFQRTGTLSTWPNGKWPRPDLHRLDILGYRLHGPPDSELLRTPYHHWLPHLNEETNRD